MNKRNFLKTLAAAAVGFTVLPAATTYDRIWRVQKKVGMGRVLYRINPEWVTAQYGITWLSFGEFIKNDTHRLIEDNAPRFTIINGRMERVHKYMPCV